MCDVLFVVVCCVPRHWCNFFVGGLHDRRPSRSKRILCFVLRTSFFNGFFGFALVRTPAELGQGEVNLPQPPQGEMPR